MSWKAWSVGSPVTVAAALVCGCGTIRPANQDLSRATVAHETSLPTVGALVIRLVQSAAHNGKFVFKATGIEPGILDGLQKITTTREKWSEAFAIYVDDKSVFQQDEVPAVIGAYRVSRDGLIFEPEFPLEPGLRYRAVCVPSRLSALADEPRTVARLSSQGTSTVETKFHIPARSTVPTAVVEHVYPETSLLPENQLKFYIHFSAPMSRGHSYENVHLVDASGREIDFPFLQLGEELWNPDGTRFTLFFDPGRVKRGLQPREEIGPVLEQGKAYTLIIDQRWRDATGSPLRRTYRKEFRAGPPDYDPPRASSWSVQTPFAGTQGSLIVDFPEPLDHALLQRLLTVKDPHGQQINGRLETRADDKRWVFTPLKPWKLGTHQLVAQTVLEDLAGNSLGRPFEVDIFEKVDRQLEIRTVSLPFEVRPKKPGKR
ncbi:MAG: hypothetical protein EXS30_10080 [Pedosphaera sp.]|nr:hypothetical protein [Pedosphaera sp.]